ncbi:Methylase involved in ubiquinone/menaquinone biosynthesis-like protein [Pelodictyon luteolum DSM 273]|uniref:Methylase involved in ubiquinone/menaquinone biosynthesis-like protein n=2 Tax=Pelodictyon luteolum TaxID=1100 RepID=Q3B1T2_CHLL3|nr:Methylase involved in ubiquinone/menaquinone biosynthesis-like protein [Pelodictyon luteolum DSM 273]
MNTESHFRSWEEAVEWLRDQPDQQQMVLDCYYDDPLSVAAERYWRSAEWADIRNLLKGRSGKALDVGAGRGIASYALARDGFTVTALEPDTSELVGAEAIRRLAIEESLPISVEVEFSERLPFADNSFDVVFARAVLHHTKDLDSACREFYRVLKPGGVLLAIREHVISRKEDLDTFLEQHPLHKLYGGENAFLLKRYTAALGSAGFGKIVVLSPWSSAINFSPYTVSALKRELVCRAGLTPLSTITQMFLDVPVFWNLTKKVLERVDNRSGRLYSFKGEKA